jgi:hypothetical protein
VRECGVVSGPLLAQPAHGGGGEIQVQPGHEVGVGIVVDYRGVLVGPGHAVDVESSVAAVEAQVVPQPDGFGEDLRSDVAEQPHVTGDAGVAPDRVGDIGVDRT